MQPPSSQNNHPAILSTIGSATLLSLGLWGSQPPPLAAQSITAAPDGTGTILTIDGNTYHIEGGTQAGANLFHSFQDFGLSSGEIANFLSHPGVVNILGRVTGGNASIIDGLIQATPNLYLMNPAGIVLGANASLNVGGDFFATTSDRIGFANGWFNTTGTNDYASLIGTPNQFAFLNQQPGAILNFGDLTTEKNVSLVGGTVLNQGKVVSTTGNVTLAAVPGERLVKISQPGMLLSLEVDESAIAQALTGQFAADITPIDLPTLLTGSGATTGGLPLQDSETRSAAVPAASPRFSNGDIIIAGEVSGQQVDLYAAGKVTPINADLIHGDTRVVRFSETGENPDQAVFIDRRADHPEQLLYGAERGTITKIIETDEDGIEVVTAQLAEISDAVGELDSVAIAAEGNAGNFWLGSEWIRAENIGDYAAQLQTWGDALTENADILLYSCFTALGATGEALVASIANLTGADVAASVDVTGSVNQGGDWSLEHRIGVIASDNPFTDETLTSWEGKLATLTVTSAADNGISGDGWVTLREAIAAANADGTTTDIGEISSGTDTIIFDTSGVFATPQTITTTTALGEFSITDDVIIEGTGQSNLAIAGTATNRVFNITANTATIRNLTIQNGTATSGSGGGIRQTSGTLTLENTTVSRNAASDFGGGIFISGDVILTQSDVSSNSAGSDGGGIFSTNNITLNQSTIAGNRANDAGGFYSPNTVILTDSTVTHNSATVQGGGGDVRNALTLTNSTIANNTAGSQGGGIFSVSGTLSLLSKSVISGNSAGSLGGGISQIGAGSITIDDSSILDNSSGGVGGGISTVGTLNLNNGAIVSGNSSALRGGGIFSAGSAVTVTDATVMNNLAGEQGGGIHSVGTVVATNSAISGNTAIANDGGGIYSVGDITLTNATVSNNSSGDDGGGVNTDTGTITLNNSTVANNSAVEDGGGIDSNGGTVNLTNNSVVMNNSASDDGGGIYSIGSINSTNSTIVGNHSGNQGGGIHGRSSVDLLNTTITNNTSTNHGGGIFVQGTSVNLNITSSAVTNNRSLTHNDGGIAGFVGTNGATVVRDSTISGNQAAGATGGIFSEGALLIIDSTISGNTALSRSGGITVGIDTPALLLNSTVSGNSAAGNAGGILGLAGATIDISNSTIAFNTTGGDGGGIWMTTDSTQTFVNSIIAQNVDTGGQAPELSGSLTNTTFTHTLLGDATGITVGAPTHGVNGNLVGVNPLLAPLANNGGATQTHALLPGSPAIDAGTATAFFLTSPLLDQRGLTRVVNGTVDLGAVEVQPPTRPTTPGIATPTVYPPNLTPLNSLNTLEQVNRDIISRAHISDLLASGQICQAVVTLDQHHTQNFAQHFGQFDRSDDRSCYEMQQQLPSNAAMLYIFAQTDQLHLISLLSEGEPTHQQFSIPRETVLAQISEFQQAVTHPALRRSDRFLSASQQLYNWFVAPLGPELQAQGITNILFGLDDGLRTVPLAALHDGEQFLIENYQATLVPSLSLTPTNRSHLQDASVLAMGISEFNRLGDLPAVPVEIASIKQNFPKTTSFVNQHATLATFERQLQTQPSQIVHLATHGNFRPGQAEDSYIQFWNRQLNLQQVEQVDWSRAAVELLILSACQTALGDHSAEYGFAGLAVQAQAGAAIAGLWSASDVGTLALMSEFYWQLSLGQPKGEALRQAQLALLNGTVRLDDKQLVGTGKNFDLPRELQALGDSASADLSVRTFWHPYYWSAFTLIGNPW